MNGSDVHVEPASRASARTAEATVVVQVAAGVALEADPDLAVSATRTRPGAPMLTDAAAGILIKSLLTSVSEQAVVTELNSGDDAAARATPWLPDRVHSVLELLPADPAPSQGDVASGPYLASTARSRDRSVFVVDDDATSRLLACQYLSLLGLRNERVEFTDGAAVIAALSDCIELERSLPALILLDRHMPTSGLQVLTWMAERPELVDVAVIMLSADDSAGSVTRAYELGVRSYLVKPVAFEALGAVVRDLELPWRLV